MLKLAWFGGLALAAFQAAAAPADVYTVSVTVSGMD